MERKFTVYQINSQCGGRYIGYTSMSLEHRFSAHKRRAKMGYSPHHPFYNAIRELGDKEFSISTIKNSLTLHETLALEKRCIAECPLETRLNLSPGGSDDARFGGEIFWERLNKNPVEKEVYLKKLSEGCKRAARNKDNSEFVQRMGKWRAENPVKAYKISLRGSRIARKKKNVTKDQLETIEEYKRRLRWKYKNSEVRSKNAKEIWSNRDLNERRIIGDKISKSQVKHMALIGDDERRKLTEKARNSINRDHQGKMASIGLKKFWEDLRKDPERYKEYMERRTASLMKTLKGEDT
ncbi:hypothetical protein FACS1894105_04230 [Clostridia bacterium]|nr:hypothetical protein FACS1894105_04230 [Clostridia bacterium]